MTKAEEKAFKKQIKNTQKLASELGYDKTLIAKFVIAENEIQLENMLIAARHSE